MQASIRYFWIFMILNQLLEEAFASRPEGLANSESLVRGFNRLRKKSFNCHFFSTLICVS